MVLSVNYDKKFHYKYLTPNLKITLAKNFVMEMCFFKIQIQDPDKALYLICKFRKVRILLTEITISETCVLQLYLCGWKASNRQVCVNKVANHFCLRDGSGWVNVGVS